MQKENRIVQKFNDFLGIDSCDVFKWPTAESEWNRSWQQKTAENSGKKFHTGPPI